MNLIVEIVRKNLLAFFRERSALFWMLIFPVLLMLLFASIFGGGGEKFRLAVVNEDGGEMASYLIKALNSTNITEVILMDEERAKELVMEEKVSGMLLIPVNFTERLLSGLPAEVTLVTPEDPTLRTTVTSFVEGLVEGFNDRYRERLMDFIVPMAMQHIPENLTVPGRDRLDREDLKLMFQLLAEPVSVKAISVTKPEVTAETAAYWEMKGHWVTVMLAYSMIFSGMVGATSTMASEKLTGGVKRLLASPAPRWKLLAGGMVSSLALLTISQAILVTVAIAFLRPEVNWTPWLIPVVLVGNLASIGLGTLVALATRNERAASEAVVAVGVMIQFISGLYFPLAMLPEPIRTIAEIVPFTWAVKAIDSLLIFGKSLDVVLAPVASLSILAVITLGLSTLLFRRWARVD